MKHISHSILGTIKNTPFLSRVLSELAIEGINITRSQVSPALRPRMARPGTAARTRTHLALYVTRGTNTHTAVLRPRRHSLLLDQSTFVLGVVVCSHSKQKLFYSILCTQLPLANSSFYVPYRFARHSKSFLRFPIMFGKLFSNILKLLLMLAFFSIIRLLFFSLLPPPI